MRPAVASGKDSRLRLFLAGRLVNIKLLHPKSFAAVQTSTEAGATATAALSHECRAARMKGICKGATGILKQGRLGLVKKVGKCVIIGVVISMGLLIVLKAYQLLFSNGSSGFGLSSGPPRRVFSSQQSRAAEVRIRLEDAGADIERASKISEISARERMMNVALSATSYVDDLKQEQVKLTNGHAANFRAAEVTRVFARDMNASVLLDEDGCIPMYKTGSVTGERIY